MTLAERLRELETRKAGLVAYLKLKVDQEDWHGVQDAASDIREIDAQCEILASLDRRE